VIREVIRAVGEATPIEIGGGIRDLDTIESYLDAGVGYVIIGTAAVKNPGLLHDACYAFPGHIIVGLDAKDGKVAVEGWSKMTGHDVVDLAKKFEDYGVEALVYTDIGRDGMMTGVNMDATLSWRARIKIPIIASGGLNGVEDVQQICATLVPEGVVGADRGQGALRRQARFQAGPGGRRQGGRRRYLAMGPREARDSVPRRHGRPRGQGRELRRLRDAGDPGRDRGALRPRGRGRARVSSKSPASSDDRDILLEMIERVAEQVFIPLTVGGGVRRVEDIRRLLHAGADKVLSEHRRGPGSPTLCGEWRTRSAISASWLRSTRNAPPTAHPGRSIRTAGARRPGSTPFNGPAG
jgi:phosphoribosylformimino-5-aminoimidazole carboxamide ribonucleotide (ProFAR) isomerase